jgi:hypothetical protein
VTVVRVIREESTERRAQRGEHREERLKWKLRTDEEFLEDFREHR